MIKCHFRFVSISPFFFTFYFPFIFFLSLCTRLCRRPLPPRLSCVWQCSSSGQPGRGGSLQKNTAGGWQGGRKRTGCKRGPLVVGCGEAKAHWVALQSAENWKFTTKWMNEWWMNEHLMTEGWEDTTWDWNSAVGIQGRNLVSIRWEHGSIQLHMNAPGRDFIFSLHCQPGCRVWLCSHLHDHRGPSSAGSTGRKMYLRDCLLTIFVLFCVLEPQLQTTSSKFNTKSIKFRPGHLQGPLWMCGTVVCRTVVEIWLLVLSSTASTAQ